MSNKVSASKQKSQFLNEYLPGRDIEYNEIVNFHIDIDIYIYLDLKGIHMMKDRSKLNGYSILECFI